MVKIIAFPLGLTLGILAAMFIPLQFLAPLVGLVWLLWEVMREIKWNK